MAGSTARPPPQARNRGPQFQFPRSAPQPINPASQIASAQRDYARRTPGVLGASAGGTGLTPQKNWNAMFPNRATTGAAGLKTSPTVDVPATSTRLPDKDSAAVQGALNSATGKQGTVTPTVAGRTTAELQGPGLEGKTAVTNPGTPTGGNTLASGFGGGSSTFVKPGTPEPTAKETAAATSSTGVQHAPAWQTEITAAHPEIGVAGSEGNKAYVAKYTKALADKGAGNFDPKNLADETMAPIYASRQPDMSEETLTAQQAAGGQSPADTAKVAADAAGRVLTPGSTAAKLAGTIQSAKDWPDTLRGKIADTVTGALTDFGLHPDTAKEWGSKIVGNVNQPSTLPGGLPTSPTPVLPNVNSTTTAPGSGKLIAQEMNAGATPDKAAAQVASDQWNAAKAGYVGPDAAAPQMPQGGTMTTPSVAPNFNFPSTAQPNVAQNPPTPAPRTDSNTDTE